MDYKVSLKIIDNVLPVITINGIRLKIVTFNYHYFTNTNEMGIQQVTATGYLEDKKLVSLMHDIKGKYTVIQ